MLRKSLYGEDVQFFNGYEWKSIGRYYPSKDRVLIYNIENKTVSLSTPLEHIKNPRKKINHVTNSFFSIDISDETEFYGIPREDDGEGALEDKFMPFNQIVLEEFHYFSHYRLISTFNNSVVDTNSLLNQENFEVMLYAITMATYDGFYCYIEFNNKKDLMYFTRLLKKNCLRYTKKDNGITFRPPRELGLFTSNPLSLSKTEVGRLSYFIIDNFKKGKNRIEIPNTNYLDFIQMVMALNNMRVNIKDNNHLMMYKGGHTRLQSNSFKIEEKNVNKQYSFTIRNGNLIVLRANGVIFGGCDFKR